MSSAHGLSPVRRMVEERRRALLPLAILFAANVAVYGFAVYPLGQRVANIEERDRAAERTLAEARRDFESARGTLTGKERAATELATFYEDVLPQNFPSARRVLFLRLQKLARESNLDFRSLKLDEESEKGSALTRVTGELILRGTYNAARTFLYQLENAPEFVVVDDIGLAQGSDSDGDLVLTVEVSTYFRPAAQ